LDNAKYHHGQLLKPFLYKRKDKLSLEFLPSYSPELNPDELLNQNVKSNAVGRRSARDQNELTTNLRSYLYSRQRKPEMVKKYFHSKHVRYAAA